MASQTIQAAETSKEEDFQTGEVLTIVGGHFVHDTFSAFLSPLLPLIIERLSLSLTLAGSLQAFMQLPSLLTPFIGYMADRVSVRYFVIIAPAVTATLMSLLGLASNYATLVIILLATGASVACFHAPAPAMIGRISGSQVGKGMSFFMAGGELGRTLGPLLVIWAITTLTLDGYYQIMVIGWVTSFILYLRLRRIPARGSTPKDLKAILPTMWRLFWPILIFIFFRAFLLVPPSIFLPTYMNLKGSSLLLSAGALSIWELAGVGGALTGGILSDRMGRKIILLVGLASAIILTIVFLNVSGWLLAPVLLALGFVSLSGTPVLFAIVQEHLPDNRAVGSGIFIAMNFLARPLAIVVIGLLGDNFGLDTAYFWGAIISIGAIPAIYFLPELKRT
jgi:FSR family fosmidomycin resistance protein-like MFS transporter